MKAEEKLICDYIHSFVKLHYDEFHLDKLELPDTEEHKLEFIERIKTDINLAFWVIFEVTEWGIINQKPGERKYLNEIIVDAPDEYDFNVLKIDDSCIRVDWVGHTYKCIFCEDPNNIAKQYDKQFVKNQLSLFGNFLRDNFFGIGSTQLMPYDITLHKKGTVDEILNEWLQHNKM